ncbi:hypothetical protein LBMAG03_12610 [Actinomycetes bacterium]|nr:hypothetical protein LBMAG03_12610 [Actinomycetes bacterium]
MCQGGYVPHGEAGCVYVYQVGSVVGLASCSLPTWLGDDYDDYHNGSTCTGCINNLDSSTQF